MNLPLMNQSVPYPLRSFKGVARATGEELQLNMQVAPGLAGMALTGAMFTACQGLIDVKLPNGLIRPCSAFLMCVCDSGDRKTAIDNLVYAPFVDSDINMEKDPVSKLSDYAADLYCWQVEGGSIRRKLATAMKLRANVEELRKQLSKHLKKKPKKPRALRFLWQDSTFRALMDGFDGDSRSLAFILDEGHQMMMSEATSHLGTFNKIWDGTSLLTLDRAEFEHLMITNPRIVISLMMQLEVFKKFFDRYGVVAKGSGHWARYLFGFPGSLKGYREVNIHELKWTELPRFYARIRELIRKYTEMIESGVIKRDVIEFSPEARARWGELSRHTEWLLRPGEYLSDINDFAAKSMEMLARLAAVFHYFNGESGNISLDTLNRAFDFIQWHVGEYKRIFSPQCVIPQANIDAHTLATYLRRTWRGVGTNSCVAKNFLRQYGPIRNKVQLDEALNILIGLSAIWIGVAPGNKRQFVNLNDAYFSII